MLTTTQAPLWARQKSLGFACSFKISNSLKPKAGHKQSSRCPNSLTGSERGNFTPPRQRPQEGEAASGKPSEGGSRAHQPAPAQRALHQPLPSRSTDPRAAARGCGRVPAAHHVSRRRSQSARPLRYSNPRRGGGGDVRSRAAARPASGGLPSPAVHRAGR